MTPKQYMAEMVLPTLEEYVAETSSRRRAYLACIVTYHMVDYLKAAGIKDPEADMRANCEAAWRLVKGVANGSKHQQSTKQRNQMPFLAGSDQYRPPAVVGELECGFSELGDHEGSIMVPTDDDFLWEEVLRCLRTVVRHYKLIYGHQHFDASTLHYVP